MNSVVILIEFILIHQKSKSSSPPLFARYSSNCSLSIGRYQILYLLILVTRCGMWDFSSWSGIELRPPAVEVRSQPRGHQRSPRRYQILLRKDFYPLTDLWYNVIFPKYHHKIYFFYHCYWQCCYYKLFNSVKHWTTPSLSFSEIKSLL